MTNANLFDICSSILAEYGFRGETLPSLIDKWRSFIEECKEGYQWDYSEYINEIKVRYLIQKLVDDKRISNADEYKGVLGELDELDKEFESLLQPNVLLDRGNGWWDRGVLKKADQEYCEYMINAHGIFVENLEK